MSGTKQWRTAWFCLLAMGAVTSASGQEAERRTPQAWTATDVMWELEAAPNDPYLQYVALQLARRAGRTAEVANEIQRLQMRGWWDQGRRQQVDLYNVFSGSLAIQESLQLDTMQGDERERPNRPNNNQLPATKTTLAELQGPTIKSHPWKEMLGDRQPVVSPLSLCVPHDQYFVEFQSLNKLLEIAEASNLYGQYLNQQAWKDASSSQLMDHLRRQLCLPSDPLTKPFYDVVVEQLAITGSDLYLTEGSDITFIFRLRQPDVFRPRVESFLDDAEKANPHAQRKTQKMLGVDVVQLTTPQREVCVFAADPTPELHVRSNSAVGMARTLAAILGKDEAGQVVTRLGETDEFRYIRTLMPQGDKLEDGLIYLSDAFIRNVVGPRQKIAERRRRMAYNHLRMMGHASLMFRTEFGRVPTSLDELTRAQCTPGTFGEGKLACPWGGNYQLSTDGVLGQSSIVGTSQFMTPLCELPLDEITPEEAQSYRDFVNNYNSYWRTFFDPIAIRIQVTPQRYRVETIILPLINSTIYQQMHAMLGGPPEPLDALPVPKRNMASINLKFNKTMLKDENVGVMWGNFEELISKNQMQKFVFQGLGNQMGIHIYDSPRMFDFNLSALLARSVTSGGGGFNGFEPWGLLLTSINAPVYLAANVKDEQVVDEFLSELDKALAYQVRHTKQSGWFQLDQDFYRLPPQAGQPQIRCHSISLGPIKWRFFWARIDKGLYVASKKNILDDLIVAAAQQKAAPADLIPPDHGPTSHAMLRMRPKNIVEARDDFNLGWSENSRAANFRNVGSLTHVARALAAQAAREAKQTPIVLSMKEVEKLSERVYGVRFQCPEGGQYQLTDDHKVTSEFFGRPELPLQPLAPSPTSSIGRLLNDLHQVTADIVFLEDGLHAILTLERRKSK